MGLSVGQSDSLFIKKLVEGDTNFYIPGCFFFADSSFFSSCRIRRCSASNFFSAFFWRYSSFCLFSSSIYRGSFVSCRTSSLQKRTVNKAPQICGRRKKAKRTVSPEKSGKKAPVRAASDPAGGKAKSSGQEKIVSKSLCFPLHITFL